MNEIEAMAARHSVRQYTDRPIETEKVAALEQEIAACNRAGGLHIQLVTESRARLTDFWPTMENSAVCAITSR